MGLFDFASDAVDTLASGASHYSKRLFGFASDVGESAATSIYDTVKNNADKLLYADPFYGTSQLLNRATNGAVPANPYTSSLSFAGKAGSYLGDKAVTAGGGALEGLGYSREYGIKPALGVLSGSYQTRTRRQTGVDENGNPVYGAFPGFGDILPSIGQFGKDLFTQDPRTTYQDARSSGTAFDTAMRSRYGQGIGGDVWNITTDPTSYIPIEGAGRVGEFLNERGGKAGAVASKALTGKMNPIGGFLEGFAGMNPKAALGVLGGQAIGDEIASRTSNTWDDKIAGIAGSIIGGTGAGLSFKEKKAIKSNVVYDTSGEVFKPSIVDLVQSPQFPGKITPEQLGKMVQGRYKQDELQWTGLQDLIDSGKPVLTKPEIIQHIQNNGVDIVENLREYKPVIHDNSDITKWEATTHSNFLDPTNAAAARTEWLSPDSRWALSENTANPDFKYTLQDIHTGDEKNFVSIDEAMKYVKANDVPTAAYEFQDSNGDTIDGNWERWKAPIEGAVPNSYKELLLKYNGTPPGGDFETGHFEPNVLAHVRTQDYSTPSGDTGLFIHEIQSDWHQKGKKEGYKDLNFPTDEQIKAQRTQAENEYATASKEYSNWVNGPEAEKLYDKSIKEYYQVQDEYHARINAATEAMHVADDLRHKAMDNKAKVPPGPFKNAEQWGELSLKRMIRYAAENGYSEIKIARGDQIGPAVGMPEKGKGFYDVTIPTIADKLGKKLGLAVSKDEELKYVVPKDWEQMGSPGREWYTSPDESIRIGHLPTGEWQNTQNGKISATLEEAIKDAGIPPVMQGNTVMRFPEGVADKILGKPLPMWQESRVDQSLQTKIQALRGLMMDSDPVIAQAAEDEMNRLTEQLSIKNATTEQQAKVPRPPKLDELTNEELMHQDTGWGTDTANLTRSGYSNKGRLDGIAGKARQEIFRRLENGEISKSAADEEVKKIIEQENKDIRMVTYEKIRRGWVNLRYASGSYKGEESPLIDVTVDGTLSRQESTPLMTIPISREEIATYMTKGNGNNFTLKNWDSTAKEWWQDRLKKSDYAVNEPNIIDHNEFKDYIETVQKRREAEGNKSFFNEPLPYGVNQNAAPLDRANAVRRINVKMENAMIKNRGKQAMVKALNDKVARGELSQDLADVATFMLKRLPDGLVNNLGYSPLRVTNPAAVAEYDPLSSVIRISDALLKTETGAVRPEALGPMYGRLLGHEIFHHLEQFVPQSDIKDLRAVFEQEISDAYNTGKLQDIRKAYEAYQADTVAHGLGKPSSLNEGDINLAAQSYRYGDFQRDPSFKEWFAEVMSDKVYADFLNERYKSQRPILQKMTDWLKGTAESIKDFFITRGHSDDTVNRVYNSFFNGKYQDQIVQTLFGAVDPMMSRVKRIKEKDQFAITEAANYRDRRYTGGAPIPDKSNLPPVPSDSSVINPVSLEEVEKHVKTYDNAVLRALIGHTRINPSVLRNDPVGRLLVAYKRVSIANDSTARVVVNNAIDRFAGKTGLKTLFYGPGAVMPIDDSGMMKDIGKAWGDVFARHDQYRSKLSPTENAIIGSFNKAIEDVNSIRASNGLPTMKIKQADGSIYVPRNVSKVGDIAIPTRSDHEKQKLFDLMEEGIKQGMSYDDPRNVLELYVKETYRDIADKQLADGLLLHSLNSSQLIDPKFQEVVNERKTNLDNARAAYLEAFNNHKADPSPENAALKKTALGSLYGYSKAYRAAQITAEKELQRIKGSNVILADGSLFGGDGRMPVASWSNGAFGNNGQRFFKMEDYRQLVSDLGVFGHGQPKSNDTNLVSSAFNWVGNTTRFASSGFDFAVQMVHLLPLLFSPSKNFAGQRAWAKATGANFATFLLPGMRESYLHKNFDSIAEMVRYGVSPGDSEMFDLIEHGGGMSKPMNILVNAAGKTGVPEKPLLGAINTLQRHTVGRFQQATNTALLVGRHEMWKALSPQWGDKFELASFITNMTGGLDTRNLMATKNQRNIESMWLAFSPKLIRSVSALGAAAIKENFTTQKGRNSMAALTGIMAGSVAIYTAVGFAQHPDEFQKDPKAAFMKYVYPGLNPTAGKKFLSYQINGDWYGIGGQFRAMAQLIGGIYSSASHNPADFVSTDQFQNPILNWYRGRGAPALNIAGSLIEGTTGIDAMPYDTIHGLGGAFKASAYSMIPFSVQGYLEGQSMPAVLAGNVGVRTSAATPFEQLDIKSQDIYGKKYADLNHEQKLDLQNKYGTKFTPQNDNVSKFFADIDQNNNKFANDVATMTARLNAGTINKQQFKDWYTRAQTEKAGVTKEIQQKYTAVSADRPDFKGSVMDYLTSRDTQPEDKAVNEWYNLSEKAVGADGFINLENLDKMRTDFLKSLPQATRDYVVRNTSQEFQNKSVEELDTARQYAKQYFGTRSQLFNEIAPLTKTLKQFGTVDTYDKWVSDNAQKLGLTVNTFTALLESKNPEIKKFNDIVTEYRRRIRLANPEMDTALTEYYGIEPADRINYILTNYGQQAPAGYVSQLVNNKKLNSTKNAQNFALSFAQSGAQPVVRKYHRPTYSQE